MSPEADATITPQEPPLIDRPALQALRDGLGPSVVDDMLAELHAEMPVFRRELQSLSLSDLPGLKACLHAQQGVFGNFRCVALFERMRELRHHLDREGLPPAHWPGVQADLIRLLDGTAQALQAELVKPPL